MSTSNAAGAARLVSPCAHATLPAAGHPPVPRSQDVRVGWGRDKDQLLAAVKHKFLGLEQHAMRGSLKMDTLASKLRDMELHLDQLNKADANVLRSGHGWMLSCGVRRMRARRDQARRPGRV